MQTIPTIDLEVVRSKGDYVVGRIGNVKNINLAKARAQVAWKNNSKSWVAFDSIEPTSIPYVIVHTSTEENDRRYEKGKRPIWPKYKRV